MTFSSNPIARKLAATTRRRNQRLAAASIDIAADVRGRRTSGDVRLDTTSADRPLRF